MKNLSHVKVTIVWHLVVVLCSVNLLGTVATAQNIASDSETYGSAVKDRGVSTVGLDPPSNDNFANAYQIGAAGSVAGSNVGATHETNEPYHVGGAGAANNSENNSVWFKFIAPANAVYTLTTAQATLADTVLSVYGGTQVNQLYLIAENDDAAGLNLCSRVTLSVTGGATYYIAVDGYAANTGTFVLNYTLNGSAPNNNFASAEFLSGGLQSNYPGIYGSTYGATSEAGEPSHDPAASANNSIWYRWTPVVSGAVSFTTRGSVFNTVIAVYTGSTVSALTLVGKNDNFMADYSLTSIVTFYAQAGTTYRIAIEGNDIQTGNTKISWKPYRHESSKRYDFNADEITDLGVFRPSNGQWWIENSETADVTATAFGLSSDRLVPCDFNGDQKVDHAVWRPSNGHWYILRSGGSSVLTFPFGMDGDIPAVGYFNDDDVCDSAVFRPDNGTWYINAPGGTIITQFGSPGDIPVAADYDSDGRTDLAIYRPSNGQWWIQRSSAGTIAMTFGTANDKPVVGDYTGDGRADVAIWRPSTGEWFILRSENGSYYAAPFGILTDLPAPGDYNGDGKTDIAVYRQSNATWYVDQSGPDPILIKQFGGGGDKPVAGAFVP